MEIRLKYDNSDLWVCGVITIVSVVLGFLLSHIIWILAAVFGFLIIPCYLDYKKNGDSCIVFDEKGIWENDIIKFYWHQIDHCYLKSKWYYGKYTRVYFYFVVITHQMECHELSLNGYRFRPKTLHNEINQMLGKEICYMTESEKKKEKKQNVGSFVGTIFFFLLILLIAILLKAG